MVRLATSHQDTRTGQQQCKNRDQGTTQDWHRLCCCCSKHYKFGILIVGYEDTLGVALVNIRVPTASQDIGYRLLHQQHQNLQQHHRLVHRSADRE